MKIGIDLGGSHIAIGVVDNKGKILEKVEKRITKAEKNNIKKVIEEYIIKQDKKISYYTKENEGVAATRNFGITHAKGNYIMFARFPGAGTISPMARPQVSRESR